MMQIPFYSNSECLNELAVIARNPTRVSFQDTMGLFISPVQITLGNIRYSPEES